MSQDLSCFKAYDVRGRVPDQLNEDIAYRIGNATAEFLEANKPKETPPTDDTAPAATPDDDQPSSTTSRLLDRKRKVQDDFNDD